MGLVYFHDGAYVNRDQITVLSINATVDRTRLPSVARFLITAVIGLEVGHPVTANLPQSEAKDLLVRLGNPVDRATAMLQGAITAAQ